MDYSNIQIETTLPRPWEEEHSFNDVLYDWMSRAPWLAISTAAHLLVFFILMAVPWDKLSRRDEKIIEATLQQTPEEIFEEPEEEEIKEEIEEEPIEEPVLKDAEVDEVNEEVSEDFESTEGNPDFLNDSPFDSDKLNKVIGIGGGARNKFGGRMGGRRNLRAAGGSGTEQALRDGLEWLKSHQDKDGMWDCDEFSHHCPSGDVCDMPGSSVQDVGVTGLALLPRLLDRADDAVPRGVLPLRQDHRVAVGRRAGAV